MMCKGVFIVASVKRLATLPLSIISALWAYLDLPWAYEKQWRREILSSQLVRKRFYSTSSKYYSTGVRAVLE